MGKPSAPTPPDPYQTAGAQTSTNVGTAIANSWLNNTNQVTPTGSLNYNQTGSYNYTDPATGQTYPIPQFTATQTLSPQQQAIQGQTEAAQYNLAGMANAQSQRIAGLLSGNVDLSAAPTALSASYLASGPGPVNNFSSGGAVQGQLGPYGKITETYGPADGYSADRQRYEDAMMARMNPQLERERSAIEQRLQDQGIRYGSQAYASAMDDYNRQANDARYAAVAAGGQEQSRLVGLEAQRAAFQNEAQNQGYQQALGSGTFANQAQAQQFSQNSQQAQFYNQAELQRQQMIQNYFNASNTERNRYMQEQYAYRNQPINEISALLSGSQVTNPNFINTPNNQIPTTDVAGMINQNYQQQMQAYQQQSSNYNNLIGGILGLGGNIARGATLSDKRTKENIHRVGTVFGVNDNDGRPSMGTVFGADGDGDGLPIYSFNYKHDPASVQHVGPMAQDVEKIDPKAVKTIGGLKHIDNARMGAVLRAA